MPCSLATLLTRVRLRDRGAAGGAVSPLCRSAGQLELYLRNAGIGCRTIVGLRLQNDRRVLLPDEHRHLSRRTFGFRVSLRKNASSDLSIGWTDNRPDQNDLPGWQVLFAPADAAAVLLFGSGSCRPEAAGHFMSLVFDRIYDRTGQHPKIRSPLLSPRDATRHQAEDD